MYGVTFLRRNGEKRQCVPGGCAWLGFGRGPAAPLGPGPGSGYGVTFLRRNDCELSIGSLVNCAVTADDWHRSLGFARDDMCGARDDNLGARETPRVGGLGGFGGLGFGRGPAAPLGPGLRRNDGELSMGSLVNSAVTADDRFRSLGFARDDMCVRA